MAIMLNETTKIVFSRTLQQVTWKNSRLLHDFDPRAIASMKQPPGKGRLVPLWQGTLSMPGLVG